MKTGALFVFALGLALLVGGPVSSPLQRVDIQRDLAGLTKRGFTYRIVDRDLIELTDPVSGERQVKSLDEQDEKEIRSWAVSRGVPILEVDPTLVDTNQYAGWYNWWTEVPLSNSDGMPLVVSDMDGNGKPEVYGGFEDYTSRGFETRAYGIDTSGFVYLRYNYVPRLGSSPPERQTGRIVQEGISQDLDGNHQDVRWTSSVGIEKGGKLQMKILYLFCTNPQTKTRVNASLKAVYPLLVVAGTGLEPATFGL